MTVVVLLVYRARTRQTDVLSISQGYEILILFFYSNQDQLGKGWECRVNSFTPSLLFPSHSFCLYFFVFLLDLMVLFHFPRISQLLHFLLPLLSYCDCRSLLEYYLGLLIKNIMEFHKFLNSEIEIT